MTRFWRFGGRWAVAVAAVVGAAACGRGPAVNAALYRDLPTLKREIARAEQAGKLDRAELERLAEAVIAREIASASGPSGARRVRAVRACASPVMQTLRERSARGDDVAAEAMLVRLTQNDVSASTLVSRHREDANAAWRAVAARASVEPGSVLLRRRWFLDPDERVRRAALEAAAFAPEPSDLQALLEAFRLDPDPLSRSLAARAVGAIGGEAAVMGLDDRFVRADEPDRLAIVDAFTMPASFAAGGERELRTIAEGKQGIVSLAAASALLRKDPRDGALVGLLTTSIDHGTEQERRLAIVFVPLGDPTVAEALERAAKDANLEVSVIALARLLEVPARRASAERRLRELGKKDDSVGAEARAALAAAGDRTVVGALARDVERGHPFRRQSAAVALLRLGETGKAARALGDDDPGVRVAVSCAVLSSRAR